MCTVKEYNFTCLDCGHVFDKEKVTGRSEPVYVCPHCYSENYEMYKHGHLFRIQKENSLRCEVCTRFYHTTTNEVNRIPCNIRCNNLLKRECFFSRLVQDRLTAEEEMLYRLWRKT